MQTTAGASPPPANTIAPTQSSPGVMMPSELYEAENNTAPPQQSVATPAQQGAPEPGSGTVVHDQHGSTRKVPFKDQVVGYAKSIRGSVLKNPETKETGERILKGDMSAKKYFEQKHA
ncbi:hypothetical protein PNOK_0723500 [Pyrrhoderma noxium]|uniref:Uncharacterized protein n=1 Tax=Pyrrhoderma noxium TaxID=2282107 RepID=A0A286UC50_9AGAM|nr:hypothetical protein PNOK_0723500 [Pyrrhoderma noxium]